MNKILLVGLVLLGAIIQTNAQTLFVPSGTNGIGTSTNSNVGIGTPNPTYKLDVVNGQIAIRNPSISSNHFSNAALHIRNTNNFDNGGLASIALGTSFSNNYGYTINAVRTSSGQGSLDFRYHINTPEGISRLFINPSGNVGIGTSNTSATSETNSISTKLHVCNNNTSGNRQELARFQAHGDSDNVSALLRINHINDRGLFLEGGRAIGDKSFGKIGVIQTDGTLTDAIYFDDAANVGIGTTTPPAGYKLAVAGRIIAEEIQVKLQSNWPDYVFSPTYTLPTLSEVEQFIKTNNHLAEVPSAQTVEQDGISVGEMNAVLLKKIEELTLYTIGQQKEIEKLNVKNEMLERENGERKQETEQLKKMQDELENIKTIINQLNK